MWLLLLGASIGIGATFLRLFRFSLPRTTFWIASTVIGFVLTAYSGLALSYLMGFTTMSQLLLCSMLFVLTALGHARLPKLTLEKDDPAPNTARGWLIPLTLILIAVGATTLTWQHGDMFINNRHNFGDIRIHVSYINNFLFGQNIPVENPIFSGTPPSYSFLVNFFSAQLVLLGLPLTLAINGLTLIGFGLIAGMLWHLTQQLFNHKGISTWTQLLFFLGGGFGIVYLFPEWQAAGWSSQYWHSLTHDFTLYSDKGIWLSNVVIAFLGTQRSFLLGLPLTLFILSQLFRLRATTSVWIYGGLGLLVGLMPIIHISSVIIIGLFCLFVGYITLRNAAKREQLTLQVQKWLAFALPAGIIAFFLVHTFIGQTQSITHFVRLSSHWMEEHGSFVSFWLQNAGILLALNVAAFVWLKREKHPALKIVAFSYVIFILGNFIIMQPWNFDNAKYLIYWFIFACMLAAYALMRLWEMRQRAVTSALIFLLLVGGTVDLVRRIIVPESKINIASAQELTLVQEMRDVIPPKASVLTYGTALNPIVDYLGRRMVYGDRSWLWSHSIDHEPRYDMIERIYAGSGESSILIDELKVDYIVVSDHERLRVPLMNEEFFIRNYKPVFISDTFRTVVYRVKP